MLRPWVRTQLTLLLLLSAYLCSVPLQAAEEEFAPEAVPQATLASGSLLLGEPLAQEPILSAYYTEHPDPIWYTQAAYPKRQKLLAFISSIADEGLLPQDYHLNALVANCGGEIMTRGLQKNCDLVLSDGFLTLANHLANGKVNPTSLTPEWKTQTKLVDLGPLLGEVGKGVDAVDLVVSLRPKSAEYQAIRAEIPKLRARLAEAPPWEPMPLKPSIKVDMEDARLGPIIERLMYWGDLARTYQSSGRLDSQLQEAIKNFQKRTGLDIDAVIGKSTLVALNASPEFRMQQLIGNLERWRWLPDDLGHKYLLVNIPSFELKGVIDNQVVLKKPVIVGRNYRRTPIFSSRINNLIFNPTWTVPPKLAIEDKLPEIQKDPQFFAKLGITVYERDRVVDVAAVNWRRLGKGNFPFRLVQQPGPQNALGQVKFMIPNTDDIYLHDTSSRNLFSRAERAFSSGCIRVHKPLELAFWILGEQGWTMEKIEETVELGATQAVAVRQPVPVHLEYWTVILDDEGKVSYRNDLYERDTALWRALHQPIIAPVIQ
ncbi:MAG TPA: L,D-transpeptidase family protein [Cellvibrionaceae bacterium]